MKYYFLMFAAVLVFVGITPYVYGILPSGLNSSSEENGREYSVYYPDISDEAVCCDEEKIAFALASVMPENTPYEALKAMAVVLRTREAAGSLEDTVPVPDIPAVYGNAVNETSGEVIMYSGSVIDAVYHLSSYGMTESASEAYGNEVKYLVSVPTPDGSGKTCFSDSKAYTQDEFRVLLEDSGISVYKETSHKSWLTYVSRTPSGRIKRIFICGTEMTGKEFSSLLGFDSNYITAETTDKGFVFTSFGSGDGVGLSVCGAIKMAEDGMDYEEIITHYYSGVCISRR